MDRVKSLILMAIIAVVGFAAVADAGIFRKRSGEPRRPLQAVFGSCSTAVGCSSCATASPLAGACNDATCDDAAEKAFLSEGESPQPAGYGNDEGLGRPVDKLLAAREARLGPLERIVFKRLKDRPDLRKKVAAYAAARGVSIDPNNLAQILDVLLAFFQKLLPLILQFVYHPMEPVDYGGGPIFAYV